MLIIIPKTKDSFKKWTTAPSKTIEHEIIDEYLYIDNQGGTKTKIAEKNCFHHGSISYQDFRESDAILKFVKSNTVSTPNFSLLRGNFLLAIHDKDSNTFFAVIDKLGKNDCYYYESNDELIISNSLTEIKELANLTLTINPQAIFNYFYFHCIPSPLTIFNEVKKLEPGTFLQYANQKIEISSYWKPNFKQKNDRKTTELCQELKQTLTKAISDTHPGKETGSFLSGGLDSSTITGLFSNLSHEKIDAYTMGFEEAGYDETEYAQIAAEHFNVTLNNYYVTPGDVANAFSKVIQSCDEPFGNSSIIPTFLCAKFAKSQGKTMLLAGDGGDELFAGNERYRKQQVFNHYNKIPQIIKSTLLEPIFLKAPLVSKLPLLRKISRYVEQARVPMPERMETYNLLNQFPHERMFTHDFLGNINTGDPVKAIQKTYEIDTNADFLQQMLYSDWKFTLSDNDIKKVNTACRLAGIDVKYPFLDEEMIEFSSHIPSKILIKNNTLRFFYKEAVKGFLPDDIINKKKHGFGLPFGEWLKKSPELQSHIYVNLNNFKSRKILNDQFIDEIIEKHRTQHAGYYGVFVWIIAVLEEWLGANFDTRALN